MYRTPIQVCWHILEQLGAGDFPVEDQIRTICMKKGSTEPRYLSVAVNYMLQTMSHLPGQLAEVVRTMAETLGGLYERDVLPLIEDVCGKDAVRRTLVTLCSGLGDTLCDQRACTHEHTHSKH